MTNIYPHQSYFQYRSKSFQDFVNEDFELIKNKFNQLGFKINSFRDFDTYQGWLERGRKVCMGQKAVKIQSSRTYARPVFYKDKQPILDKSGRAKFYSKKQNYSLFHKTQTNFNQIPTEL